MITFAIKTDVLVVGAGQAGAQLCISLRQGGFSGSIALVGEEPDPPYDRPPLSKEYLAGDKAPERLLLRPLAFWESRGIDLVLGQRVTAIDPVARTALTASGQVISYGQLVWAAGGTPRPLPLPGTGLTGVHMIRTREQVDRLRAAADGARDVVIIGGGYIGLEAAAVLVKQGKRVTVLEAQDRVLARVTAEPVSRFYETEHCRQGVNIRTNVAISMLEQQEGRVSAVLLDDGERLPAQLVIVGIGLVANQAVLAEAGADCGNGVLVDEYCRTSLPGIFAIGDCACHPNPYADNTHVRLESVPNAIEQAKTVAGVILGQPRPYRALPWFWSNQYDLKLQAAGLNAGHDQWVLRGDPANRSFSLIYLRNGRFIAIDAINSVKDFMQAKPLIEAGSSYDPDLLADVGIPLKSLL